MDASLPASIQPLPAFGGRTLMEIFASAAAGDAEDQEEMSRIALMSLNQGTIAPTSSLDMAEIWLKMALTRGRSTARTQLVNVLLLKALHAFDANPSAARMSLAEAVSYLDELAGEGHEESAGNLDRLLAGFVPVVGTVDDRDAIVAEAKQLRNWRDQYGALA